MRLDDQAPAQERLLRSGTRPELRLLDAAAQTRIVCVAGIRLDSRKSVRPLKGIICPDISEFESHMLSQPVPVSRGSVRFAKIRAAFDRRQSFACAEPVRLRRKIQKITSSIRSTRTSSCIRLSTSLFSKKHEVPTSAARRAFQARVILSHGFSLR